MVTTVTINPAMDKTLIVNNFQIDNVNRVGKIYEDVGGKGINVSRVLNYFNVENIALSILGGKTGNQIIKELDKLNIKHKEIIINEETRVNTKIVDEIRKTCTDVNEEGPIIEKEDINKLINEIIKSANKNEYIVLSGSVPKNVDVKIYGEIINKLKDKNVKIVLDTSKDLLKEGIKSKPWLIKPNLEELEEILNKKLDTTEKIIKECKNIINSGIENIVLTLGKDGILYCSNKNILKINVPKVNVKSTVGAGDSVVATMVYGFIKKFPIEEILKNAAAMGTATVTIFNTNIPSNEAIEKYKKLITVEKIEII